MSEKRYKVCLNAPLGRRNGTMVINEADGNVSGRLKIMNRENPFSGRITSDGRLTLTGVIHTLMSTVEYAADGTLKGNGIFLNLKTPSGASYSVFGEELNTDDEIL